MRYVTNVSEGTCPNFLKLKVRGEKCTFKICKILFSYNNDKCDFSNGFLSGLSHKVDRNIGSEWKVYLLIFVLLYFSSQCILPERIPKAFYKEKNCFHFSSWHLHHLQTWWLQCTMLGYPWRLPRNCNFFNLHEKPTCFPPIILLDIIQMKLIQSNVFFKMYKNTHTLKKRVRKKREKKKEKRKKRKKQKPPLKFLANKSTLKLIIIS